MLPTDPVRRRRAVLALAGVLVLVVAAALVGVTLGGGGDDDAGGGSGAPSPTDTGTPLEDVDTTTLAVAREPFCEAVEPASVLRALDLTTEDTDRVDAVAWENGQQTALEPGLRDVAHEHGCSWQGPGGVRARAWVFVPPTTVDEARALRSSTTRADGCTPAAGAPAYGTPTVAADCQDGPRRERVLAGLFGDAWLTCTLEAPRAGDGAPTREELAARASTWCMAVAGAASAG